ncbi:hypothetical protein FRX31_001985 [Thalictrum thalictroides]|uniref:Uncharacterized protein n=1 Tax=Thalictrum thalictroides TaxID=46969 RepID=A0A7J6XGY1_THATH|nr:hypothetical protein FRX31_001985 [Thalictrum thalictroides]
MPRRRMKIKKRKAKADKKGANKKAKATTSSKLTGRGGNRSKAQVPTSTQKSVQANLDRADINDTLDLNNFPQDCFM